MSSQRTQKMTSTPSFGVRNRGDDIPQPWNFYIHEDVESQIGPSHDVYRLGQKLIKIPVHPLPCPLVRESDDWLTRGIVSGYDFMETWEGYLDVMSEYGNVIHSEFTEIPNGERETSLPRTLSGTIIVVELPGEDGNDVYLKATIWATGEVQVMVMYESRLEGVLPYIDHFN